VSLGGDDAALLKLIAAPLIGRAVGKRMGLMLWWKPFLPADVNRLTELIADGKVRPMIDRTFPLDRIVEALHWVDDGNARGKVVILPQGS
jgi:NADPH:quinone reductase-like Zn-dependent oxidoreductase